MSADLSRVHGVEMFDPRAYLSGMPHKNTKPGSPKPPISSGTIEAHEEALGVATPASVPPVEIAAVVEEDTDWRHLQSVRLHTEGLSEEITIKLKIKMDKIKDESQYKYTIVSNLLRLGVLSKVESVRVSKKILETFTNGIYHAYKSILDRVIGIEIKEKEIYSTVDKMRREYYQRADDIHYEMVDFISKFEEQSIQNDVSSLSVEDRLLLLEGYAKRFSGEGVGDIAKKLFPELLNVKNAYENHNQSPQASRAARSENFDEKFDYNQSDVAQNDKIFLPSIAPELWQAAKRGRRSIVSQGTDKNETPPDFIRRVYSPWLGNGLTKADIRRLDPALAQSLYHWLRTNQMPPDIDLPTKAEVNTRLLERLEDGDWTALGGQAVGPHTLREARRLDAVRKRRHEK